MKPIRVIVADDHALVRAGFCGLLRGLADVEVVGEAGDGHGALELASALNPDIVFLDVSMPGLNGLDTARRLKDARSVARVVMLSMHSSEEYVLRALRAGCSAYLLKESSVAELEIAVRAVARGEMYLSPAVSKQVVANYVDRTGGDPDPLAALTPRQREVLQLVAEGHTSKSIGYRLGLSFKTVEAHRIHIMERLAVRDLAGLIRFAIRVGLVTADA